MERETLNIVVVGHVDHGKSTLIGRLLYDTDSLPQGAIEKVKNISKEKGKDFEYAYLLDAFEEEQKQGITIDITMLRFFTKKRDYVIIDAPGHKEFLKNMISGAASAEAALLMVDAKEGIQEQSKRHGYILSLLGIKKVYVVVNKMDLVDYSEERYIEIQNDFNKFLGNLNIYPEKYIPISAYHGENLLKQSDKMDWYKGDSIIQCIDNIPKEVGIEDKALRFPIQDVYKFDSRRIIAGRLESGKLSVGDEIVIYPSGKTTKVKTIEHWGNRPGKSTVYAGESVGITVEDEFFNKRGEVICKKGEEVTVSNIFNANVFWLGKSPLVTNKTYKLKLVTQEVEFEVLSINKVIDSATLENSGAITGIEKNQVGEVTIKAKSPICFDEFNYLQSLGRFVIIDDFNIWGGGIISPIEDSLKRNVAEIKSTNLAIRKRLVSRKEREAKLGQKGKVIWFTGVPGCGKNELAVKLEKKLFDLGKKVYCLDSSNLRFGLSSDLSFTKEDAHEQTRRIAEVANLFADSGTITIVSSISRFAKDREEARNIIGKENYLEINVEANSDICKARDAAFKEELLEEYEKAAYPVTSVYISEVDFNSDEKVEELLNILNV